MLVALVAKSCPTLVDPKDCSLPGSSVHGILQARILEWVAISSSRSSSQPRNPTQVSCIAGRFFTNWTMYSFSVYSCHLFLIFFASVESMLFLSFIVPIVAWNVPLVSLIFLMRSIGFSILLFSSISLHCSLRKALLPLLAFLWNSAFKWVYLSFSPLPLASLLFSYL